MTEPKPLADRTIHALLWTYGGAVGRVLSQLVVQLLLARFLGPEAFGQAAAALLVLSLGWIFAEAGFGSALIQKEQLSDQDIGYALGWVLTISCPLGLAVVLCSPWIADALGSRQLQALVAVAGLLIPVQAVGNIPSSLMRRRLDVKRAQIIYLAGYLLCYGLAGLPLAMSGAGPWAVVVAYGLHVAFGLVASYAVVRHTLRPRLRGDAALRRFGLQVTLANCTSWATENVDRALVSNFWGSASLGVYSAAFALSRSPAGFLLGSLQPVIFAASARAQDDRVRLAAAYRGAVALAALLSWPLFTWMACHANALINLLYGDKWLEAGPLFMAFCAGLPFVALMTLTGPLLWSLNAVRQDVVAQVLALALVVCGLWTLQSESLAHAVWLVPVVYALRASWMTGGLLSELGASWRELLLALRGGGVLTILAVGISVACQVMGASLGELEAAALSAALLALLSIAALKVWPHGLMNQDLLALLLERADSSDLFARICRWLGIKV